SFYENQPLPASSSYSRTNLVSIPSGAGQNYYLILKTDGNNQIGDVNEFNNVRVLALGGALPDLKAGNFNWSGSPVAGQPIQVTYTGTNVGAVGINAQWNDAVYLSTNATLDARATRLGSFFINSQVGPAGGTYSVTNNVTLPQLSPTSYYLILNLDDNDGIVESTETNHVAVSVISVIVPDLMPVRLVAPGTVSAGQAVPVTCVVTNQGSGGGLGYWYDGIYLSTNAVLNADDRPVSYVFQNHTVTPSGTYSWTNTITIPQLAGGLYHLFVVADDPYYGYQVSESSKTNNTISVAVSVQVADLAPASITAPAAVSVGQAVPVACVVTNQGAGGGFGRWYDRIYLSTNAVLNPGDQPLSSVGQAHSVTAGGSYTWTNSITIPQIVGGTYRLFVVADDPRYGSYYQIAES